MTEQEFGEKAHSIKIVCEEYLDALTDEVRKKDRGLAERLGEALKTARQADGLFYWRLVHKTGGVPDQMVQELQRCHEIAERFKRELEGRDA